MHVTCKHAHQLLETVYEGILMSCSGGEVKPESRTTTRTRTKLRAVNCQPLTSGKGCRLADAGKSI
jgi:hypothetical protein